MSVEVEIICIGNELLIGKIPNTNSNWISTQSTALGANVKRVTVIQDIIEEIASTINEALARKPRFIITTGGLGPTFDDITFEGIAKALNQRLVVNPSALGMVKTKCIEYAKKRQMPTEIEMTPPRVKMATFPENTEPVVNPVGTAPGLRVQLGCTVLFSLPGVPREMEAIFTETIKPAIKEAVGSGSFCQRSIFVEGIIESQLAPWVTKVMTENAGVYVKSHYIASENKPRLELHLTMVATQTPEPTKILIKSVKQLSTLIIQNGGSVQEQPF